MKHEIKDLDIVLATLHLDARLETSLVFNEAAKLISRRSEIDRAYRKGLGPWHAFTTDLHDVPALIGAPEDMPDAGCSIWFNSMADPAVVACAFQQEMRGMEMNFLDPSTGTIVMPVDEVKAVEQVFLRN